MTPRSDTQSAGRCLYESSPCQERLVVVHPPARQSHASTDRDPRAGAPPTSPARHRQPRIRASRWISDRRRWVEIEGEPEVVGNSAQRKGAGADHECGSRLVLEVDAGCVDGRGVEGEPSRGDPRALGHRRPKEHEHGKRRVGLLELDDQSSHSLQSSVTCSTHRSPRSCSTRSRPRPHPVGSSSGCGVCPLPFPVGRRLRRSSAGS